MNRNVGIYLYPALLIMLRATDANAHGEQVGLLVDTVFCVTYVAIAMTRNVQMRVRLLVSGAFLIFHGLGLVLMISPMYLYLNINMAVQNIISGFGFLLLMVFSLIVPIVIGYYYNKRIDRKAAHLTTG